MRIVKQWHTFHVQLFQQLQQNALFMAFGYSRRPILLCGLGAAPPGKAFGTVLVDMISPSANAARAAATVD